MSSVTTPPALRMTWASPDLEAQHREQRHPGVHAGDHGHLAGGAAPGGPRGRAAPRPRWLQASARSPTWPLRLGRPAGPYDRVRARRPSARMSGCAPWRNTGQWSRACSPPLPEQRAAGGGPRPGAGGDVLAAVALPGFDNSAMDGYAARCCRARDRPPAPRAAAVAETSRPAHRRRPAGAGHGAGIMTGAPLPAGRRRRRAGRADRRRTDVVETRDDPAAGTDLRRAGEDIAEGSWPSPAGDPLGPPSSAWPPPRDHRLTVPGGPRPVLSTGSELVAPGRAAAARPDPRVELRAAGGRGRRRRRRPRPLHFVPDDVDQSLATVRASWPRPICSSPAAG